MPRGLLSWKSLAAAGCALLIVVGIVAASLWFDHRTDRRRPMYRSLVTMEQLQWDLLKAGKKPRLVRLHPKSHAVRVNDTWYHPEKNVTILVEERDGKTCIQGNNQYHDRTEWICVDPTKGRPSMGGLR